MLQKVMFFSVPSSWPTCRRRCGRRIAAWPELDARGRALHVLGISALAQPVGNSTGWLLISQGRSKDMLRWGFSAALPSWPRSSSDSTGRSAWRGPTRQRYLHHNAGSVVLVGRRALSDSGSCGATCLSPRERTRRFIFFLARHYWTPSPVLG